MSARDESLSEHGREKIMLIERAKSVFGAFKDW
jgi:hypothetical protein